MVLKWNEMGVMGELILLKYMLQTHGTRGTLRRVPPVYLEGSAGSDVLRGVWLVLCNIGFYKLNSISPNPNLRRLKGSRLRGFVRMSAMLSSKETFSIEMFPF